MRILVTGGAGFIGSHVVDAYVAAGHQVAIVDNLVSGRRENLNPNATFYEVDIRDAEPLAEVFEAGATRHRQPPRGADRRGPLRGRSALRRRRQHPGNAQSAGVCPRPTGTHRQAGPRHQHLQRRSLRHARLSPRRRGPPRPAAQPLRREQVRRRDLSQRLSRDARAQDHHPALCQRLWPAPGPPRGGWGRLDLRGEDARRRGARDQRKRRPDARLRLRGRLRPGERPGCRDGETRVPDPTTSAPGRRPQSISLPH